MSAAELDRVKSIVRPNWNDRDPVLGRRKRLTKNNPMVSSQERRKSLGLPERITGNPLGCGCSTAYFRSCGTPVDGQVEADYQCDSSWHNYVMFQVHEKKKVKQKKVALSHDKFGNLTEDKGFVAGELETL